MHSLGWSGDGATAARTSRIRWLPPFGISVAHYWFLAFRLLLPFKMAPKVKAYELQSKCVGIAAPDAPAVLVSCCGRSSQVEE